VLFSECKGDSRLRSMAARGGRIRDCKMVDNKTNGSENEIDKDM
jgi:hypothetical protein